MSGDGPRKPPPLPSPSLVDRLRRVLSSSPSTVLSCQRPRRLGGPIYSTLTSLTYTKHRFVERCLNRFILDILLVAAHLRPRSRLTLSVRHCCRASTSGRNSSRFAFAGVIRKPNCDCSSGSIHGFPRQATRLRRTRAVRFDFPKGSHLRFALGTRLGREVCKQSPIWCIADTDACSLESVILALIVTTRITAQHIIASTAQAQAGHGCRIDGYAFRSLARARASTAETLLSRWSVV